MLDQGYGDLAPGFNYSREQAGFFQVETAVEANRESDVVTFILNLDIGQMSPIQWHGELVFSDLLKIHTEEQQKVREFEVIDGTEAIEFVDARRGQRVFDLREPGIRYVKFAVPFALRDLPALLGDVSCSDSETRPQIF
jgi:hypothetical protein